VSEQQGFLPITDAMARDLDNGKADNRPIEDFMPDDVLQQMKDAQGPTVRAQDLLPISKAEAARRTAFDGESLPHAPATKRVIPAPFRRDRISGGKHGKSWREMAAESVEVGDIIPDVGLVRAVHKRIRYEGEGKLGPIAAGLDVFVTGGDGRTHRSDARDTVRVFR
jgi:hypothetical protein